MTTHATTGQVIRLLEITPIGTAPDTNAIQDKLLAAGDRIAIVPMPEWSPCVLVQTTDLDANQVHDLLELPATITELRRHLQIEHTGLEGLSDLIATVGAEGVVIGRAAIERAIQRRRLDILIIAADVDPAYAQSVEKVVAEVEQHIQVVASDLTAAELGQAIGCRRAGCIGLLRNRQSHNLVSR